MMDDKEHFYHDFPAMPNLTILPWLAWGVILGLVIAATFYASRVYAEPIAVAKDPASGAVLTVHSEPCAHQGTVNLTNRATWQEATGKVFEGCAGASGIGVLIFYFPEDKSVFPVKVQDFKPVSNA